MSARLSESRPAPLRLYILFGIVLAIALLGFCLLLRADVRRVRPLDTTLWSQEEPANFVWDCTETVGSDYRTLEGYALVKGERFESVNNFAVLYHKSTNEYLRLPTVMVRRSEINQLFSDGINYECAGFYAYIPLRALEDSPEQYELCFAYGANGHKSLIHTGQYLGGEFS
ncbi:hypothetical protein [uncultured Ruthenibacterium sp.]|uniref:hypothetical protein n=1 Tax=uncultured Ruthenibacterium sp. TaxID=1905347 RepID=UPI00349EB6FF